MPGILTDLTPPVRMANTRAFIMKEPSELMYFPPAELLLVHQDIRFCGLKFTSLRSAY